MAIKRIELLNVPIDILSPGNLEEVLLGLLEQNKLSFSIFGTC